MENKFSLFEQLETNLAAINNIDDSVKITLGPTGKTGIFMNKTNTIKFLTNGSALLEFLDFETESANVIRKLLQQAAIKTSNFSGDGSATTTILSCQLLKSSIRFLVNGYNPIFIGTGLTKICYFLREKVLEFSMPIKNIDQLTGILKTTLGKKINPKLFILLKTSISKIGRDGLIVIEENITEKDELEVVQGIEIDKGFASSYFVTDLKNFEVNYEKPYVLILDSPLKKINQIREIIDFIKRNNKPLVIIGEDINKEIISTLVLNNMQKKFKVVIIQFSSLKFLKTGVLEDLATLTFAKYLDTTIEKNIIKNFRVNELGQAEKVIIRKEKSTFIISKFSKLIAERKINELNRKLINCETEYEKDIFRTRIARLSGNITKIKIGLSNQYEMDEQRKKVESAINTIKSTLEEGSLPGGGAFYLFLREELRSWASLNLIGEEFFAAHIVSEALIRPFIELLTNTNSKRVFIQEDLIKLGYPFSYDLIEKKLKNTFEVGLLDSAKTIRAVLWNSISIVSTIITTE